MPRQHPKSKNRAELFTFQHRPRAAGAHTLRHTLFPAYRNTASRGLRASSCAEQTLEPSKTPTSTSRRRVSREAVANKHALSGIFHAFYKERMQAAAISLPAHVKMDVMRRPHTAKRLGMLETPPLTKQTDALRGALAFDVRRRRLGRVPMPPYSFSVTSRRPKTAVTRRALEFTPDAEPSRLFRSSRI